MCKKTSINFKYTPLDICASLRMYTIDALWRMKSALMRILMDYGYGEKHSRLHLFEISTTDYKQMALNISFLPLSVEALAF